MEKKLFRDHSIWVPPLLQHKRGSYTPHSLHSAPLTLIHHTRTHTIAQQDIKPEETFPLSQCTIVYSGNDQQFEVVHEADGLLFKSVTKVILKAVDEEQMVDWIVVMKKFAKAHVKPSEVAEQPSTTTQTTTATTTIAPTAAPMHTTTSTVETAVPTSTAPTTTVTSTTEPSLTAASELATTTTATDSAPAIASNTTTA